MQIVAYIDLEIRDLKQVFGFNISDFTSLKVRKFNKTSRVIRGNIIVKTLDFGNQLQATALFFRKQGGEYRLMPYKVFPKKLCNYFNDDIFFYDDLTRHSNIPEKPVPCPFDIVRL